MPACLICGTEIEPFMSFGKMPVANGFLTPDQFADEYFFDLEVGHCQSCSMVQLTELIERERMFHDQYAFFSSTSARMATHFKGFAEMVMRGRLSSADPLVVEIGSNDGIMLQHFAQKGIRHLGVEPSANVAEAAIKKGINTLCSFFDEEVAAGIVDEYGQADAILGANVMCHIPYLHSVVAGFKRLLKPEGVIIFEDPYLGDIIEKTSFDQIYDEHAFYFSVSSITDLFRQHGMEVIDAVPQDVHGGSMRYTIGNEGSHKVSDSVQVQRDKEDRLGLDDNGTFELFSRRVNESRDSLMDLLRDLHRQGKRVIGYGATSKSTTVTNFCGITPGLVEFISDTTPIKQGKYSPGAHVPVRPYEEFVTNYPDYALLFAWNHMQEIMSKEQSFRAAGGKWIVYVPKVGVIS